MGNTLQAGRSWLDTALAAAVSLLGCWMLYAQTLVIGQESFRTLVGLSRLPILCALGVLWVSRRDRGTDVMIAGATTAAVTDTRLNRLPLWIAAAVLIAAVRALFARETLTWALAAAYAILALRLCPSGTGAGQWSTGANHAHRGGARFRDRSPRRPGNPFGQSAKPNDSYFLNVVVSALRFPDRGLQTFDGLHLADLPPVEQTQHLPQVYELGVAVLTELTGASPA